MSNITNLQALFEVKFAEGIALPAVSQFGQPFQNNTEQRKRVTAGFENAATRAHSLLQSLFQPKFSCFAEINIEMNSTKHL